MYNNGGGGKLRSLGGHLSRSGRGMHRLEMIKQHQSQPSFYHSEDAKRQFLLQAGEGTIATRV